MLEKTYRPAEAEAKHYQRWEDSSAFSADPDSTAAPYTIMIPPPNVTGSLHIGHALTFTLQDILIRHHRMLGRDALWQSGTDHAGIATQMVVERQLEAKGVSRHDLGREAFIAKIWEWKHESGGAITRQLRRLGASLDWKRERFTMDEGLSKAVRKVFVDLHKKGLVYRDKRLVNWDPKLHTAISDLEVEQRETKGSMWYFKYPLEGRPGEFIVVGTTRPETMLGDTAVAVHPDDERYQSLVGTNCVLPIVGRLIPIIADSYADPEKGSGAVKITPAHDFNDFDVGKRNNLPMINVLDCNAHLNENAPSVYQGLDRFVARNKIVAEMDALGLLEKIEDNPMATPYGDRSGVVIEPWLTDQWFVDAATLAAPAIKAVEDGRTTFVPKHWENTYFEWMRNIQPWCVSRQIWWGHQVPAWYGPDGFIFVELTEDEAQAAADKHYGKVEVLIRDTDVLDTWFSSALWPFSTLGWPEETPETKRYYPTDVLVTGFDIIFFWVARMMMMGIHFMDDVPFRTVYIHALVRDEKGQKMSKSKGNVIDPLDLIDTYGCDAVRFTLAALAAPGRDVKMSESRVAGYRNFTTKLWNAARFCQMNECHPVQGFQPRVVEQKVNRWIVGKTAEAARRVTDAIAAYRFNDAAQVAYAFTWGTFCDWYLEFAKPIFGGADAEAADVKARDETRATAAWVLDQILIVLHPIMPFITEELWGELSAERPQPLIETAWPHLDDLAAAVDVEMDWVVSLIEQVRSVRSEMNVPPGAKTNVYVVGGGEQTQEWLSRHNTTLLQLGRLAGIYPADIEKEAEKIVAQSAVQFAQGDATYYLVANIDLDQEKVRLAKEIKRLEGEVATVDKKLGNQGFMAKAPPEVVEEQRGRRADYAAERDKMVLALNRINTV